jgi:carotenoid cleavage dioxygenase-like enzyme
VKSQPWKGALEPSTECSYTVDPSKVKGRIPDDLRGTYVRLGPGNTRIGDRKQGHWFDGDGMVSLTRHLVPFNLSVAFSRLFLQRVYLCLPRS